MAWNGMGAILTHVCAYLVVLSWLIPLTPLALSPGTATFIVNPRATMNFCENPAVLDHQGYFLDKLTRDSFVFPLFVQCKLLQGGNIMFPTIYTFDDFKPEAVTAWSDKTSSKLFWRGRSTGSHHSKKWNWRDSHRIRLHGLAHNLSLADDQVSVLVETKHEKLRRKTFRRQELNDAYLDVGLISPAMQCDRLDGTCDDMEQEIEFVRPVWSKSGGSKYKLDVGEPGPHFAKGGVFCD